MFFFVLFFLKKKKYNLFSYIKYIQSENYQLVKFNYSCNHLFFKIIMLGNKLYYIYVYIHITCKFNINDINFYTIGY